MKCIFYSPLMKIFDSMLKLQKKKKFCDALQGLIMVLTVINLYILKI